MASGLCGCYSFCGAMQFHYRDTIHFCFAPIYLHLFESLTTASFLWCLGFRINLRFDLLFFGRSGHKPLSFTKLVPSDFHPNLFAKTLIFISSPTSNKVVNEPFHVSKLTIGKSIPLLKKEKILPCFFNAKSLPNNNLFRIERNGGLIGNKFCIPNPIFGIPKQHRTNNLIF